MGRIVEGKMITVSISKRFQIVNPKQIRHALQISSGQKMAIFQYEGRIVMIPVRSMGEARGFLKGIDTTVDRED